MAAKKTSYTCTNCGATYGKWMGRCSQCDQWNTIEEDSPSPEKPVTGTARNLASIGHEETRRIETGIAEFDLICGGGIVPGSVILVGGEPGIGKSTLALQVASRFPTLYISGEESPSQISARADRLGIDKKPVKLSVDTTIPQVIDLMDKEKPVCCIIDSIQTLTTPGITGGAGSVSQIRESASRLAEQARKSGTAIILIGHITKEGSIAGPKVLEHLVDTVLYFEGDFTRDFRVLRAFKNRYGSVNEIGIFRMTSRGLEPVSDRNEIFLSPATGNSPGHAITPVIEGTRVVLIEVQGLATFSTFPNPRRMADGLDLNRLIILAAVLEKHGGLKLGSFDVFINVGGGLHVKETAADLAVAMAIASSLKNQPLPAKTGFLGEISLAGDIRPVSQVQRRVSELSNGGFERIILPSDDMKEAGKTSFSGELTGVSTVKQVLDLLF